MATVLDSAELDHFPHCRKFCWRTLHVEILTCEVMRKFESSSGSVFGSINVRLNEEQGLTWSGWIPLQDFNFFFNLDFGWPLFKTSTN